MKRFFLVILFLCFGAAHAADRSIRLGPFTPDMTFDEIEKEAGIKGTRWCKTWEPNPTFHYCKLTIETNEYHLVVQKGGANETLEMDRRIPVPEDMSFDDIMKQVLAPFIHQSTPHFDETGVTGRVDGDWVRYVSERVGVGENGYQRRSGRVAQGACAVIAPVTAASRDACG